ncbi:MAG: FAD-dependent oxidoreductase [Cryomorphaceae bacterium]|nr:FAD-dependent oxidoreductase [Cryomorphaceae bacterium]
MDNRMSYWESATLLGTCDLGIVGGGIVGMFTALYFRQSNPSARIVVIDRSPFGLGGTTRNAGFACFGSPSEILSDLRTHGTDDVKNIVSLRWEGLHKMQAMLGTESIGYLPCGSMELFENNSTRFEECANALTDLNDFMAEIVGEKPYTITQVPSTFRKFNHSIANHLEGSIDTGKLAATLRSKLRENDIELITGMNVLAVEEGTNGADIVFSGGVLKAHQACICSNGFAKELKAQLDVLPARNLVLVTTPIDDLPFSGTFHLNEGYFYFRNVGNRVLIGGGRHLDHHWKEEPYGNVPPFIEQELVRLLKEQIIPNHDFQIEHAWIGYLGIGGERTPIVEKLSPHVFCGVRMGGMGVAIGSKIGEMLSAKCITEKN